MYISGTRGQQSPADIMYDASGTITTGGTTQLLLPKAISRSFLLVVNLSSNLMMVQIGSAFATATITSGVVTAITVNNAGAGFTVPPGIEFIGGGNMGWNMANPTFTGGGTVGYPAPARPAKAHAVLSGGAISSIVIDDGGKGYAVAPYVKITNSILDPNGYAIGSATQGIPLVGVGDNLYFNDTSCPVDPVSIWCATGTSAFSCKYME